MKLKNALSVAAAAILASMFSVTAAAAIDGYVGLGVGSASYDYDDVDDSTAVMVYGGFRPGDGVFGVELAYLDLGDADVDGLPGVSFNMSGFNVSGVFKLTLDKATPLGVLFKLGFFSFDTDLETPIGNASESSTGLSYGIGLEYVVDKQISFRGEIQGFTGVEDFADDEDVTLVNVGLGFHF